MKLLPKVQWNMAVHADSLTGDLSFTHPSLNDLAIVTGRRVHWRDSGVAVAGPDSACRQESNERSHLLELRLERCGDGDRLEPSGTLAIVPREDVNRPAGMNDTYTRVSGLDCKRIARLASISSSGRYPVRAARQLQPLAHPLAQFVGSYSEANYGTISFELVGGKLQYRWGGMYGPVEIFDASKNQLRIEIVGSGNVVAFQLPDAGSAESVVLQRVTFHPTH